MTYQQTKQCSKCGGVHPLSAFRWLKVQQRHMPYCRDCERKYNRERYMAKDSHYNSAVTRIAYLINKHGNSVLTDALRLLQESSHE